MSPWVPVALTFVGLLVVLGAHLLFIGRWIGRVGTEQANQGDALKKLGDTTEGRFGKMSQRIDDLGDELADEASRRSGFEQRLASVEEATKAMWDVRDKLIALTAANEVHEQYRREKMDRLEREVAGVSRQLGTIAAKGLEYRPPAPPAE